jgi:hypothetical protein
MNIIKQTGNIVLAKGIRDYFVTNIGDWWSIKGFDDLKDAEKYFNELVGKND